MFSMYIVLPTVPTNSYFRPMAAAPPPPLLADPFFIFSWKETALLVYCFHLHLQDSFGGHRPFVFTNRSCTWTETLLVSAQVGGGGGELCVGVGVWLFVTMISLPLLGLLAIFRFFVMFWAVLCCTVLCCSVLFCGTRARALPPFRRHVLLLAIDWLVAHLTAESSLIPVLTLFFFSEFLSFLFLFFPPSTTCTV